MSICAFQKLKGAAFSHDPYTRGVRIFPGGSVSKKSIEQFSCSDCGFIESDSYQLIRPSFFGKPLLPVCFDCFMGFFEGLLGVRERNTERSFGSGEDPDIQKVQKTTRKPPKMHQKQPENWSFSEIRSSGFMPKFFREKIESKGFRGLPSINSVYLGFCNTAEVYTKNRYINSMACG